MLAAKKPAFACISTENHSLVFSICLYNTDSDNQSYMPTAQNMEIRRDGI